MLREGVLTRHWDRDIHFHTPWLWFEGDGFGFKDSGFGGRIGLSIHDTFIQRH